MSAIDATPTAEDMAIDLAQRLTETESAISLFRSSGVEPPEEAFEIRAVLRRALYAETVCRDLKPGSIIPWDEGWSVYEGEERGWCWFLVGEDALAWARKIREG